MAHVPMDLPQSVQLLQHTQCTEETTVYDNHGMGPTHKWNFEQIRFKCCAASLRRRVSIFSGTPSARLGEFLRVSALISSNF
jgi:hypothetical protein